MLWEGSAPGGKDKSRERKGGLINLGGEYFWGWG